MYDDKNLKKNNNGVEHAHSTWSRDVHVLDRVDEIRFMTREGGKDGWERGFGEWGKNRVSK